MNIYLLSQDVVCGYDTYDSCVVFAKDEESARMVHPFYGFEKPNYSYRDWCKPDDVQVTFLGSGISDKKSVICASFNAG